MHVVERVRRGAFVVGLASVGVWLPARARSAPSAPTTHASASVGASSKPAPSSRASASASAAPIAAATASASTSAPSKAAPAPSASADDPGLDAPIVDDTPIADAAPSTAPSAAPSHGPRALWHPRYAIEVEAHASVGGFDVFGPGVGGGVRVSVPIGAHFPFHRIDDDLGVGVGLDVLFFAGYAPSERDSAGSNVKTEAFYVPIYVQWNVWLGARASLFLEPTLLYRTASYIDPCLLPTCAATSRVVPTGFAGMRFRLAEHFAVTARVGWPTVTLGASWL